MVSRRRSPASSIALVELVSEFAPIGPGDSDRAGWRVGADRVNLGSDRPDIPPLLSRGLIRAFPVLYQLEGLAEPAGLRRRSTTSASGR